MPGMVTSVINPSVMCCNYSSPVDFSATYTSGVTITCAGAPFAIDDANCTVLAIRVRPASGPWLPPLINGQVSITASANVITVAGAGTAPFHTGDTYRVLVAGQDKGYVQASDSFRFGEVDPLDLKVCEESIYDGTNTTADLELPSSDGFQMIGYKSMSLTGKIIDADAGETNILTVQVSNDEDILPANRDWITIFGYRHDLDAMTNNVTCINSTVTFAWSFENLNYKYCRLFFAHPASHTNTLIIKMRRCAL